MRHWFKGAQKTSHLRRETSCYLIEQNQANDENELSF